jgi:hypothetical protein
MTKEDLVKRYGPMVSDRTLAEYLDRDVRTLRKYAHKLGGRELIPGVFYFPLIKLDEVILKPSKPQAGANLSDFSNPKPQQQQPTTKPSLSCRPLKVIGYSAGKGGQYGKVGEDKHGLWSEITKREQQD